MSTCLAEGDIVTFKTIRTWMVMNVWNERVVIWRICNANSSGFDGTVINVHIDEVRKVS